jgi:DNA (cytosine-5)-methyltransferase 1
MRYGSLFAGIGGFDLGFDRAGLKCKWQVEKDPYCWQVLWEKWPKVDKWDDVKTFPPDFSNEWNVDVICGGFPCQDISDAGTRVGISGERSGLWSEFARVVRVLRPRFVVVENSAALLRRGAGQVFGDLAACGYSLEWDCLPAIAFGARHIRDRLFIVATTDAIHDADGNQTRSFFRPTPQEQERWWSAAAGNGFAWDGFLRPDQPRIPRTAHGVPRSVDRTRAIGNAVFPDIAEWIGRRIIESENQ